MLKQSETFYSAPLCFVIILIFKIVRAPHNSTKMSLHLMTYLLESKNEAYP
jgi:hypothetical protein